MQLEYGISANKSQRLLQVQLHGKGVACLMGVAEIYISLQQLKRVKRATDRKGTDQTVTEEKFALLFQSNFSVNGELDVSVKVLIMSCIHSSGSLG